MNDIDWNKVYYQADTITGLPIHLFRDRWIGACYIDGSSHKRRDKIIIYKAKDGSPIITENGGETISMFAWLKKYGGASTDKEVFDILRGNSNNNFVPPPPKPKKPSKFGRVIEEGYGQDGLFSYLLRHFNREDIELAYRTLNITPISLKHGDIGTRFWYVNSDKKICHDKIVLYGENGRRDKSFGGGRFLTAEKGYRNTCYFGSHLLDSWNSDKKVLVVESEKSALLIMLYWKRLALATGGLHQLKEINPDWMLLPDRDGFELWNSKYPAKCSEWWELYPDWECGSHDDIGDYIMYKLENKK